MSSPSSEINDNGGDGTNNEEGAVDKPEEDDGHRDDGLGIGGSGGEGQDDEEVEEMEDEEAPGGPGAVGDSESTAATVAGGLQSVKALLGKEKTFDEYITVSGYVYEEKVTGKCAVMFNHLIVQYFGLTEMLLSLLL